MCAFLDVFRGETRIGRIIFDDKEPGGLWEATDAFEPLRHLFETENEYLNKAGEDPNNADEFYEVADAALTEILKPGMEARQPDGRFCFEIIGIRYMKGELLGDDHPCQ